MGDILPSAAKRAVKTAVKYVKDDLGARYGLAEDAVAEFRGEGIGVGCAEAGPLSIVSERGGSTVMLAARAFPASAGWWNGPNVIPDDLKDGSFEASLWHDLLWAFAGDLSAQLGMGLADYLAWTNGILAAAWAGYGERVHGVAPGKTSLRRRIGYNLCRLGAWLRRRGVKFSAMLLALLLLAGCGGCANPPPWTLGDSTEIVAGEPPAEEAAP